MPRNCSAKPAAAAEGCPTARSGFPVAPLPDEAPGPARILVFARPALLLLFLAALGAGLLQERHALALETGEREYPLAPLSIALPFPEDDQQSALINLLLPHLREAGGQDIALNYFPGRGGSYAWREISGKENKGHVLAVLNLPTFFLQTEAANAAYSLDDITVLCILAYAPCALWVSEDSPIGSIGDLIALGRDNPQPQLIAGTGSHSDHEIITRILARAAGIPLRYLPYTGSETASNAALDKTVAACWAYAVAPDSMPGMRPLAVAGHMRSLALPDTPTFLELDIEVLYGRYIGLGMPVTEDEYTAGVIGAFFSGIAAQDNFLPRLATAGYIPYPAPFADSYTLLPRTKAARETLEALSRLAATGYILHPPALGDLSSMLARMRTELEVLIEEYPQELR